MLLLFLNAAFGANVPCTILVSRAAKNHDEHAASIHEAADVVTSLRRMNDDSAVVVCLSPGTHTLNGKPLKLTAAHNNVIWRAEDPKQQTILSGGVKLKVGAM